MDTNKVYQMFKDKTYQKEQDAILLQSFNYIRQNPGKGNRQKLSRVFNHWLNVPEEKLHLINEIIQTLHEASLLIDDIEDNANIRRGKPVAHDIYGVPTILNTAVYIWCLVLDKVKLLNHPDAIKVLTEEMLVLHRGQGIDIYWRDSFTVPSEADYKLMAVQKKGGLFMLAVRLMQLFSTNKEDFSRLITILGLYFQILDDYSNTSTKWDPGNKGFCADLTEGKFSFPVIHAIRNDQSREEILNIVKQRTHDVEIKKYFISLLEKNGSLKYTRDTLELLIEQAWEEATRIGHNPLMEKLLNKLQSWKSDTYQSSHSN